MASHRNRIRVFHPDYDPPELLFFLPSDDGPNHDSIPCFIVYDAVEAFASYPSGAWLSKSQDASNPIDKSTTWLEAGDYFYHVSTSDRPWPVVVNFESWSFPHTRGVPAHWREGSDLSSHIAPDSRSRGLASCQITRRELALEYAHIIPRAEKPWFGINRMDQYAQISGRTGDSVADSPANRIWMTSDAHKIWDGSLFTIVPDMEEQGDVPRVVGWRTHRLNEHPEVLALWHRKPLQPSRERVGEYFYARFIWDIFPLIQGFLHSGPPRRLMIYNQSLGTYEIKMLTKAERRIFTLNQGRSRSASPIKRQRSTHSGDDSLTHERRHKSKTSNRSRNGHTRQRLSSLDRSQDSAVAGTKCYIEDSDGYSIEGLTPDFLQGEISDEDELCRGRKRTRM